eukprot:TRINITY_DN14899_c0_g1_i1.p1 TRINITY_DN14899_c0_g1~~TRINITY_DN14899_c0_g1_i1.p1  ORF type:complete len:248 (+),score=34.37 TRINITY_DN14899_c0_g1_i1:249-992(+)
MLDLDGTLYQALDLKERAWHATIANTNSIGIEIANIGAYTDQNSTRFSDWYHRDPETDEITLKIPQDSRVYNKDYVGHPVREELIEGEIQGMYMYQYDLTQEQYDALVKLTAGLVSIFPEMKLQYPTDPDTGEIINKALDRDSFDAFKGILGHYHVQTNKQDPGPAFQWDYLMSHVQDELDVHQSSEGESDGDGALSGTSIALIVVATLVATSVVFLSIGFIVIYYIMRVVLPKRLSAGQNTKLLPN